MSEFKKLDPEIKANWVKALRGGDYIQVQQVLYAGEIDNKYEMCCLGVLEHVCGRSVNDFDPADGDDQLPSYLDDPKSPVDILRQVIPSDWDHGRRSTVEGYLAHLNDSKGFTFEEIADFIDKNL